MTCEQARKLVSGANPLTMDRDLRHQVMEHLMGCQGCVDSMTKAANKCPELTEQEGVSADMVGEVERLRFQEEDKQELLDNAPEVPLP